MLFRVLAMATYSSLNRWASGEKKEGDEVVEVTDNDALEDYHRKQNGRTKDIQANNRRSISVELNKTRINCIKSNI